MLKIISKGLERILLSFGPITKDFSMLINKSKNQQIMILGNPSTRRDSFFLLSLFFLLSIHTSHAQGVYGYIKESYTQRPLANVAVSLNLGDATYAQSITDSTGYFILSTGAAGRFTVTVKASASVEIQEHDVFLDGYTLRRLEFDVHGESIKLSQVQIVALRNQDEVASIQIHPEDLLTTAGNFEDPVRVAHSEPGIVLLNDQANHLSSRGASPVFNSWLLEGLEITNPNHTNNAGTLADVPTSYGGGINMFSAQALGSTELHTGVRPFNIKQTPGASINMHLHETEKPEWRAKAGLIGFELGGGAQLSSNHTLDFNLRYSFTGLLANLGVDFGGEEISFYDGVISYHQRGQKHNLKAFGWAGRSTNIFNHVEDPQEIDEYKDFFDIDYGNTIAGLGLRYDVWMGAGSLLKTGVAYSTLKSSYMRSGQFSDNPVAININGQLGILSSFAELHVARGNAIDAVFGVQFNDRIYDKDGYPFYPFVEETSVRPHLQIAFAIGPALRLEAGGDIMHSIKHERTIPGYRGRLGWTISATHSLFAGFRKGAGEPQAYSNNSTSRLHFIGDQYEAGWNFENAMHDIRVTGYYHRTDRLRFGWNKDGAFHIANYPFDGLLSPIAGFANLGLLRQFGVEGKWEIRLNRGWHVGINQSAYQSETTEGYVPVSRYNGRYATHAIISKEVVSEIKSKKRIWNFSMRGIWNGGLLEQEIDTIKSAQFETTYLMNAGEFVSRLPDFTRIDASITRTTATGDFRWRWSLDIQNLFGFSNISYHYYDPFLNRIEPQEHLGIIPVLSLQLSW